jgi:hypothetical protein
MNTGDNFKQINSDDESDKFDPLKANRKKETTNDKDGNKGDKDDK